EIIFDNDDDVLSIVDIVDKTTIQSTNKRINHINEYQNLVYIATNYGISVFNLERLEFGDTYFIGNNGSQIQVNQTAVFGNYIYAACSNGYGIKKAQVANPNLIDYQNWETIFSGNYLFIKAQNTELYTVDSNRKMFNITNETLTEVVVFNSAPVDIKTDDTYLTVTTNNNVFVYDDNFNIISQVNIEEEFSTTYTAAVTTNNNIYIGTNDFGILNTTTNTPSSFEEIHPDGPLLNAPFSTSFLNDNLWVAFGGYSTSFGWDGGLSKSGISNLNGSEWNNISFDSINAVIENPLYLSHIAIDPTDANHIFVSSYYSGLIEINEENIAGLYNQTNSTLTPFYNDFYLTNTSNYDSQGNLWITNARVDQPLNKFSNGNWESFSFTNLITDKFSNNGFSNITFDSNNNLFIGSHNYGLIGFSENNGNPLLKNIMGDENNMPSNKVTCTALDNSNSLWIGTLQGLRVLYNTSGFFEDDDVQVEEIIIEEDGIAKELLFQQFVTDIEVDGSNNKWIGTADSGLFYFSSDGQTTIYHFTEDNSPLPSNIINDVSLDTNNGIVYIATSRGLVSYKAGGSSTLESLTSAFAYPNPVRPNFNVVEERVKIKDISENVNIKITDIEGNLVAEAQSNINQRYSGYNLEIDGGTAYWNGKNLANNVVASGVYLIMLSDLDTYETKVIKLMVIR
uniref:type IX secretion system anionic LPS delivery protein PorZ n=1 Tax=Seonamhaeicola sp. TaxID=1912245 RepID=UPI003564E41A